MPDIKMLHNSVVRFFCIICMFFICFEWSNAAYISQPSGSSCSKPNTFFKHNAIYTYDYTITTSSGFIGVSKSRSGSKLSCIVTLKVPRKCEIVMQMSKCTLTQRSPGPDVKYTQVDNSESFLQDLQRYSVYFQMNKGLVIPDSIVADDDETLTALNMKRGLISALQFQILDPDDYTDDVEEDDIFGFCNTKYSFSETDPNTVHTFRNLRDCQMPQVFLKQFNSPMTAIKPMLGGIQDGTISEKIYPFVSEVSCDYKLNKQKRLANADCLQLQYFKTAAYKGDVLATAMTNISQSLKLTNTKKSKLAGPDMSLDGRSVVDIRYTYSADLHTESRSHTQILHLVRELATAYSSAQNRDGYAVLPGMFQQLVDLMRRTPSRYLHLAMTSIFDCSDNFCEDPNQEIYETVYLDAVEVCGTEDCMIGFFYCLNTDLVSKFRANNFLKSMTNLQDIPETVLEQMHGYCKQSESSVCWLSLGTIFSNNYVEDEKEDSVLFQVQDEMTSRVLSNCNSETMIHTQRQLNTAVKLLNNIGVRQNIRYMKKRPDLNIGPVLNSCLLNKAIPTAVKRSVLRSFKLVLEARQYKDTPAGTVDTLFTLLEDNTEDISVRTQAFSMLIKTTVKEDINRIITYRNKPNTKQMVSYMTSALRTLLEVDSPDMKEIKASWQEIKNERYFSTEPFGREAYLPTMSKSINIGQFFKLPITDILGGELVLDLVYEPSSSVFHTMTYAINYYYSNQKHNLFEVSLNVHGFELLMNVFMKRVDLTPQDLMKLYQQLKARAASHSPLDDDIHFAKFQRNIVKAVENILQAVNHPVELDFDFSVDIIVGGQEVAFLSLQEVIDTIRQMKVSLPSNKSMMQIWLQQLMSGKDFNPYRFTEMLNINRNIPTCAGLPLNMTVSWSGKASMPFSIKSNLAMFMSGRIGQLSGVFTQYINYAHEISGGMEVPFGDVHTSGAGASVQLGHERGMSQHVRYGYSDPMVLVENPTKRKVEFELFPILPDKENEDLSYANQKLIMTYGENKEVLPSDPAVQTTIERCWSGEVGMMIGRSLCYRFNYPNVTNSRVHAYFPLSGPFDLRVRFSKVDSVLSYTSTWEYAMEKKEAEGYTYNVRFEQYGKGDHLSRYAFMHFAFNSADRSLSIKAGYPEVQLSYESEYNMYNGDITGGIIQEWMKFGNQAAQGYLLEYSRQYVDGVREYMVHLNYTTPYIGWDLAVSHSREDYYGISYTYFCSLDKPLLYMFHPIPLLAAENGDRTHFQLSFRHTDLPSDQPDKQRLQRDITVGIYDKQVTAVITLEKTPIGAEGHGDIIYNDGENEIQYAMTVKRGMIMSPEGMVMLGDVTLTSDDIKLNIDASVQMSRNEYSLKGGVDYSNNEVDVNVSRKKRSLKSIYNKFKELAKAKMRGAKDKLYGDVEKPKIDIPTQPEPIDKELPETLPERSPAPPSIWDLKNWNAHITATAIVVPIFPAGVTPGTAPPTGIEAYVNAIAKHPWNGGYSTYTKTFKLGSNRKNSMANFKVWLDGESISSVSDLNGRVIIIDGEVQSVKKQGGFYIDRKRGKLFNYTMNYHSPDIDKDYSILFNWDAPGHHEPLIHVYSQFGWKSVPFFNHVYDEIFTYEDQQMYHAASFENKMVNVTLKTSLDFERMGFLIDQNGSISLKVADLGGSVKYNGIIDGKNHVIKTKFNWGSMPEKTDVYNLQLEEKSFTFTTAVIPEPDGAEVPLMTTGVQLWGHSHFMVTTEWTPAHQQYMEKTIRNGVISTGNALDNMADNIRYNLVKPPLHWYYPSIGATPFYVLKKVFMENMLNTLQAEDSIIANLFPVQTRENEEYSRMATRYDTLILAMKKSETKEVGSGLRMMRKGMYLMLKSASKMLYYMSTETDRDQKIDSIIKEHRYTYLIPTPFTFHRLTGFPEMQEGRKHQLFRVRQIDRMETFYKQLQSLKKHIPPKKSVASIFGHLGTDRVMNIATFDGELYGIPAQNTRECSYLLAADVRQKRWSLVLSPDGVTLITSSKTVAFGWDKNMYIDNCKVPSYDVEPFVDYGSIQLTKTDYRTTIETSYGLKLFCDNADDVCTVVLDLTYRNETIGLLGNSDFDTYNDRLLQDGHVASSFPDVLPGYVLSGPATCHSVTPSAEDDGSGSRTSCRETDTDSKRDCTNRFYKALKSEQACFSYLGQRRWDTCNFQRCADVETNSCYVFKALVADCDAKGLLSDEFDMNAVCPSPITSLQRFDTGYLDVVFVVSMHSSMDNKMPVLEASIFKLGEATAWRKLDDVQVGLVGYGDMDLYNPHILYQSDGRLFGSWSEVQQNKMDTERHGTDPVNGINAITVASSFPFRSSAHKMIVLVMTQIPDTVQSDELASLKSDLLDQGITLNIVSDHDIVSSGRVSGVNSEGNVIVKSKPGYHGNRDFPEDDYSSLVHSTKGALWDIQLFANLAKSNRMAEEFVTQVKANNNGMCH